MNYYDQSKEYIEISNKTEIIKLDNANLSYQKIDELVVIIKDIQTRDMNQNAYVIIADRPTPTKRKQNELASTRMDISINDDTGIMKLSLWGSKIDHITESRVYLLRDLCVTKYRGVISINTTHQTSIEPSSKEIQPAKSCLVELATRILQTCPKCT